MLPDGRRQQASQHLDRCRSAGAIGTQKAEKLAGIHAQVHILNRGEIAKSAREIGCIDGRGCHESL